MPRAGRAEHARLGLERLKQVEHLLHNRLVFHLRAMPCNLETIPGRTQMRQCSQTSTRFITGARQREGGQVDGEECGAHGMNGCEKRM